MYSSFQIAKHYVESALDYSKDILIGEGHQGPFDHLLKLKNYSLNQCMPRPFDPSSLLLYAVTDSKMNKKWGRSISDAVQAAIEGGATIVQLRFDLKAPAPFSSIKTTVGKAQHKYMYKFMIQKYVKIYSNNGMDELF